MHNIDELSGIQFLHDKIDELSGIQFLLGQTQNINS